MKDFTVFQKNEDSLKAVNYFNFLQEIAEELINYLLIIFTNKRQS
jgi:hypothetical protein